MADENQTNAVEQTYTVERYLKGIVPNASVTDDSITGVLFDVGVAPNTPVSEMTERQRDLCIAYLYIRLATNPKQSSRVTDRDADWEHSEGSEQWSASQLQQFLILARKLLEKWGEDTALVDDIIPTWGFVGRNIHNPQKKKWL